MNKLTLDETKKHQTWRWLGRVDGIGKIHLVSCFEDGTLVVARYARGGRYWTACEDFGPGISTTLTPQHDLGMDPCGPCFRAWAAAVSELELDSDRTKA